MAIPPGTLIGQYRVHSLIAEGGMGAVYYAEHVVLGTPAAIKVLLPFIASNTELVQRFVNEALVASRLKHRHLIEVLDCGMFPSSNAPDAQWYIALEFLHGKSLGKLIEERAGQPFDLPTILHVLAGTGSGVHAAHERLGIVHRDIKPDNIFISPTEDDALRPKVLDFGIAKLNKPKDQGGVETRSQMAMGTPAYAAPEQLKESKDVDRRADVFALGVIAYEMVTGVRPWGSTTSLWEIIAQHQAMKAPPDPRALRPDLPVKWAEVVARAMHPDPDQRWASVKDFIRALADATPMPFSANGMAFLSGYAKELAQASSNSLTVGRPLPPLLQRQPAEIATAPERPARDVPPVTVSDGVPRVPGAAVTPVAALVGHPISTIPSASGQVVSSVPLRDRRRVLLIAGAALAVAVVAAAAVALIFSGSSSSESERAEPAGVVVPDAGAATTADAVPAMSALAIVTEPADAEVFVDGVSYGRAPVNTRLRVGAETEVRAELPGYEPALRTARIGPEPGTLRLTLERLVDAGAAPPDANETSTPRERGRSRDKPRGGGRGTGDGSGSEAEFDPYDVL